MSYLGTPVAKGKYKTSLVKLCQCIAYWLEGTSNTKAAMEPSMWKGAVTDVWKRCRAAVVWHELNKAKLTDALCIIDITWGPHRRVAKAGAPSRPRVLEQKPFQVALAYRMDGERRQFIPGSLSVQGVQSKKATYNGRVALSLMDPSCRISCDQGGEWARLPSLYADVKTVNHSLEWVPADGTCTNLGEAHNGILKCLGAKLSIWKGGVPDAELNDRWQELAWRVNEGFHRESSCVGDKIVKFMLVLAERQRCSVAQDGSIPPARRLADIDAIPVPPMRGRVRRLPRCP